MLTGVQDNGGQLRIGETVWTRVANTADAGGVAFDPGTTGRFAAATESFRLERRWNPERRDQSGAASDRDWPRRAGTDSPALVIEDGASRFYSNAAVVRRADGVTQLAVGTNRVWYSERWGQSRWDGTPPGRLAAELDDPAEQHATRARATPTTRQPTLSRPARFPPGLPPQYPTVTGVRALKWAGPDRLYALLPGAIHRFDRNPPNNGAWARTNIVTRPAPPVVAVAAAWPAAGAANLPDTGAMNDLAVHDPAAGPHGSFYVATSHPLEPVWWFDGTALWEPARLGTTAVAPVGGAAPRAAAERHTRAGVRGGRRSGQSAHCLRRHDCRRVARRVHCARGGGRAANLGMERRSTPACRKRPCRISRSSRGRGRWAAR